MIRSLWTAASGMEAQQQNLDVIANNLANVNTNGYKGSNMVFQEMMYDTQRAPGANSTQSSTTPTASRSVYGSQPVSTERNSRRVTCSRRATPTTSPSRAPASSRSRCRTHERLHARRLVPGELRRPARHEPGLPRHRRRPDQPAGDQRLHRHRRHDLGQREQRGGQDQPDHAEHLPEPGGPQQPRRKSLPADGSLGNALDGQTPGTNGIGTISQGYIETSNVQVVEEMVNMIQAQRAYEINSKAIQTAGPNDANGQQHEGWRLIHETARSSSRRRSACSRSRPVPSCWNSARRSR